MMKNNRQIIIKLKIKINHLAVAVVAVVIVAKVKKIVVKKAVMSRKVIHLILTIKIIKLK